jgi:ubiquinone/menaquinone biosynthesis C-methylase UbiE
VAGADYYDREAPVYDESRGGSARAQAAADAVTRIVPAGGLLVDVAGGTGIVSAALAEAGFDVVVADVSTGMLRLAADRLPGRVLAAAADRLPLRDGSVDVVTIVWLLHMLPTDVADAALAEAARVLRPGGHLVTTVDKEQAHGHVGAEADDAGRVRQVASRFGLEQAAATTFSGPSTHGSATGADPVFPLVALRRDVP